MNGLDLGRGAGWGALAGVAFGLMACAALLVSSLSGGEGVVAAVAAVLVIGGAVTGVAACAGAAAGCLSAAVALAVRSRLRPATGGPLAAAAVWSVPWAATGHLDLHDGTVALFFLLPLVLGCLAARRWGTGVA